MASSTPTDVTQLLLDWSNGDQAALAKLMPLVHDELRRLAHHYMRRERADHTLQTTALVHEAYLRLVDQKHVECQNRARFFSISAQLMRHILVDHARSQNADKRGGARVELSLHEAIMVTNERATELIVLDDALTSLALIDPQKSRIVELRFFGGLTIEEMAEVLGISAATIKRQRRTARAWLYREISKNWQDRAL